MVYRFDQIHEEYFGKPASFREEKRRFNDLVLSMEDGIRKRIEASGDSFTTALSYARLGNYIDFGALNEVKEEDFIAILNKAQTSPHDEKIIEQMKKELSLASSFLLICDNCGEIVLDKLFLEQLKKDYPHLVLRVMVRGGEVLNDATIEDALYVGMNRYAQIMSSGTNAAGTIYSLLSAEARRVLDETDVILAKGQGNYESLSEQGRHIYYAFLCKCEKFMDAFGVKRFAEMLVRE